MKKIRIPEKIRIGSSNYDVKKCRIIDWTNSNVVGQINYGAKKLKLKMFEKDHRLNEDNFFHEVAHGVLKELEFNHPQMSRFRNDEGLVQELGLTLRTTFIDLLEKQELR